MSTEPEVTAVGEQAADEAHPTEFNGDDGHRYKLDGERWIRIRKVDAGTWVSEPMGEGEILPALAVPPPQGPQVVDPHTRVSAEMFQSAA